MKYAIYLPAWAALAYGAALPQQLMPSAGGKSATAASAFTITIPCIPGIPACTPEVLTLYDGQPARQSISSASVLAVTKRDEDWKKSSTSTECDTTTTTTITVEPSTTKKPHHTTTSEDEGLTHTVTLPPLTLGTPPSEGWWKRGGAHKSSSSSTSSDCDTTPVISWPWARTTTSDIEITRSLTLLPLTLATPPPEIIWERDAERKTSTSSAKHRKTTTDPWILTETLTLPPIILTKREPQVLGSPTRSVGEYPTAPWPTNSWGWPGDDTTTVTTTVYESTSSEHHHHHDTTTTVTTTTDEGWWKRQVLGSPSRSVVVYPTAPWPTNSWGWPGDDTTTVTTTVYESTSSEHHHHHDTTTTVTSTDEGWWKRQVLGSPTRSVGEYPTPPWTRPDGGYTVTVTTTLYESSTSSKHHHHTTTTTTEGWWKREPQVLGSVSRSVVEYPTPPYDHHHPPPPPPTSTPCDDPEPARVTIDERQVSVTILPGYPSRSTGEYPSATQTHWPWWSHTPSVVTVTVTETATPPIIISTLTLPPVIIGTPPSEWGPPKERRVERGALGKREPVA